MPFISAGLEIQTIGCSYVYQLNVNLDHYCIMISTSGTSGMSGTTSGTSGTTSGTSGTTSGI